MDNLIEGYRTFRRAYYEENHQLFRTLAKEGQSPKVLLIGCSDSRVDPSVIFSAKPGDMFVIRNVANLVPPFNPDHGLHGISSAVEFAVRRLKVEHIIVLGHSGCGGIQALLDDQQPDDLDFFSEWMSMARVARDRALLRSLSSNANEETKQRLCEQEVVAASMTNLMSFPWIRKSVEAGQVNIHGLWFDVQEGELFRLNPVSNAYETV